MTPTTSDDPMTIRQVTFRFSNSSREAQGEERCARGDRIDDADLAVRQAEGEGQEADRLEDPGQDEQPEGRVTMRTCRRPDRSPNDSA